MNTTDQKPHPGEVAIMVVCNPCGSIIKAEWVVREECPKQAILRVERCRCGEPLMSDDETSESRAVSDAEIDEAVAQLLEHNGVEGWDWRSKRDHAKGMEQIIRNMLAGEFNPSRNNEAE